MLRNKISRENNTIRPSLNLSSCLAKTWKQLDGSVLAGRDVFTHCLIVGKVAQELIKRMPIWLSNEFFPKGSALTVACHDDGKVSPTFQRKIYINLSSTPADVWQAVKDDISDESAWGGHAGVSQATLEHIKTGKFIPEISGQHHGFSPNLGGRPASSEVFGGNAWLTQRIQLIEHLKLALNEDHFPEVKDDLHAKLLAGLTTVSDWIGSGKLFDDPSQDWQPLIEQAVNEAGFIAPKVITQLSFQDVFGFPPRQAQVQLFEMANQTGVYVLEAPMGMGKTEAALYAAYRLLEQNKATGIYFALPTQLTSEKIHERVADFLRKILEPDSLHTLPLLVHGQAWLKQQMGEDAAPGGAWFSQGKKGILAPFAVGTIDQALMAVLHVKHGFVRTFALAGKVVILDEVHTYDAYTGTVMDELVDALKQLGCTVIILSATLTQARRQKLLKTKVSSDAYPLISGLATGQTLHESPVNITESRQVKISIQQDEKIAIEEALKRAEAGQQVLWIENTVTEAQEKFTLLSARAFGMGIETGLLHSRFTPVHRQQNEERWVTLFGKAGWDERQKRGRILVGTQVLEQSLDIDADFLVTRLAPTDMILQRLGRLWRHQNPHRQQEAKEEAWVIAPLLDEAIANPEQAFGTSAKVYAPYVLCRTLEVWQQQTKVSLPADIRSLIESTYRERSETENMARYFSDIEQKRETLRRLALQGMSFVGKTKPEEIVKTRYSEQDAVEVLLLKGLVLNQTECGQKGSWLTFTNDETLFYPHNGRAFGQDEWRHLSAMLQCNLVKVADHLAPDNQLKTNLSWLKDYLYLGAPDQKDAVVRVALVGDDEQLTALDGFKTYNRKYQLSYNAYLGYRAQKL
jgi:CRISPR-associated endonuclease/helicase Cas3